jgi:hypothetical protein
MHYRALAGKRSCGDSALSAPPWDISEGHYAADYRRPQMYLDRAKDSLCERGEALEYPRIIRYMQGM